MANIVGGPERYTTGSIPDSDGKEEGSIMSGLVGYLSFPFRKLGGILYSMFELNYRKNQVLFGDPRLEDYLKETGKKLTPLAEKLYDR